MGPGNDPHLYRTSPVIDVIDDNVIYTTTRSYYRLSGELDLEASVSGGVSLWFAKRFKNGFPRNWRELLDVYLGYLTTQENNLQDSKSNALEMMSLLSCEGFALNRNSSPEKALSEFEEDEVESEKNGFSHSLEKCEKKKKYLTKENKSPKEFVCSKPKNKRKSKSSIDKFVKAKTSLRKKEPKIKPKISSSRKGTKSEELEKRQRCLKCIDQNILRNKQNVKDLPKTKSLSKRNAKPVKKPSEVGDHLKVPSFCSPAPGHGLYRTRSGRHVFPPLQHWTYQRLSVECDNEGNETVVFHPGSKSVLKNSSVACEYLRRAKWIHRQFEQDQLLSIPSPSQQKVLRVKKKRNQSNCVKNIFDQAACSGSPNSDVLSESLHFTALSFDADSSNWSKKQHRSKESFLEPLEGTSVDAETNGQRTSPILLQNRSLDEKLDTTVVEDSMKQTKTFERINTSDSKLNKSAVLDDLPNVTSDDKPTDLNDVLDISPGKNNACDKIESLQKTVLANKTIVPLRFPKSNLQRVSVVTEDPVTMASGKYNLRRRRNRLQTSVEKEVKESAVRNLKPVSFPLPVVTIVKVDTSMLKRYGCYSALTVGESVSSFSDVQKLNKNDKRCTRSATSRKKFDVQMSKTRLISPSKPACNTANPKQKMQKKIGKASPTQPFTKPKATKKCLKRKMKDISSEVDDKIKELNCKPTNVVDAMKEKCAKSNISTKKSLEVTAKRGTLKRRKQAKEVLNVLNQPQNEPDFFTATASDNFNFENDDFQFDPNRSYLTPYTPVSKLPSDFDQNMKTPAWFQTPSGADAFSCAAVTPAHLKVELDAVASTEVADKCIIQMQKKHKRKHKTPPRFKKTQHEKKKTVIPDNLFRVEVDEHCNSSDDDDYFSS